MQVTNIMDLSIMEDNGGIMESHLELSYNTELVINSHEETVPRPGP